MLQNIQQIMVRCYSDMNIENNFLIENKCPFVERHYTQLWYDATSINYIALMWCISSFQAATALHKTKI